MTALSVEGRVRLVLGGNMQDARVLVVDDSAAMRALFADVLEQAKNVRVVGTAASAAQARDCIRTLDPNVITLDVEMPDVSGIEFLEEIMKTKPLPVVMLSSITQAGTETALKAYELGAVDCFPKPLKATPDQFAQIVKRLGKIVVAAANCNMQNPFTRCGTAGDIKPFQWNGHLLAMSTSTGGLDAITRVTRSFPNNCPPTLIVLQADTAVAKGIVSRMDAELACSVHLAKDGVHLRPGHVHVAADPTCHVIVEPGPPARLRLISRDLVDGVRPSANLLFGSIARAGLPAVAAVLTGIGADGSRGLKMMRDAGCTTFVQAPETAMVDEAPTAAIRSGGAAQAVLLEEIGSALLAACAAD